MNLIGLKNLGDNRTLTLGKINSKLKAVAKKKNICLSIIQTHSEIKAVSYLHKNRKKYDHIIISPGIWDKNGYLILETLSLIKIPFSIVSSGENKSSIFKVVSSFKFAATNLIFLSKA